MGCALNKLFGGQQPSRLEEEEETPKVYSWEKREKVNMEDFILDGLKSETVGRLPGVINGQQFIIKDCEDCDIYIFDHCATVTVDDCTNCRIFIGPIKQSIFIRDCSDCVVSTICQQFRTRDCKKIAAFISCVTQPIVESSSGVKFGCLQFSYYELRQQLEASGVSVFNNNWSTIHDFTPVPGENNYMLLHTADAFQKHFKLPEKEPLNQVTLSMERSNSLIPFTCGVKQRPVGEGCLVAVFPCENRDDLARRIITRLVQLTLVQTLDEKLNDERAKQIFSSSAISVKAAQGALIIMEFVGDDAVQVCQGVKVSEESDNADIYISPSVEEAKRELEAISSLWEMQMAV